MAASSTRFIEQILPHATSVARTASDTSATSDSATVLQAFSRVGVVPPGGGTDQSVSSDVALIASTKRQTTADTSLTSDTATRSVGLVRFAVSSAVNVMQLGLRISQPGMLLFQPGETTATQSDISVSRDSAVPSFHVVGRSASATSLSSDVAVKANTFPRPLAETSLSTDAATENVGLPRPTADASVSTDATTVGRVDSRTGSDASVSTDSSSRAAQFARNPTADTSVSTDGSTTAANRTRSAVNVSISVDNAFGVKVGGRTVFSLDTSGTSDSTSQSRLYARVVSDTSTSTDAAFENFVTAPFAFDESDSNDFAAQNVFQFQTILDQSTSTDDAERVVIFSRVCSDISLSGDSTLSSHLVAFDESDSSDSAVFIIIRGHPHRRGFVAPRQRRAIVVAT